MKQKRKFDIWMEGFHVMESSGTAEFVGTYEADNFLSACQIAADEKGWGGMYDPKRNCVCGCELFDNEKDARRGFG